MEKSYRLEKYVAKEDKWLDYGSLPVSDIKAVIKGYKRSNMEEIAHYFKIKGDEMEGMYTRKGTMNFYWVSER